MDGATFHVDQLPLIARLHRWGFRGSHCSVPAVARILARAGFYALRRWQPDPVRGKMRVSLGGRSRPAWFNAKNRQFASIYFDQYSGGYEPETAALIDVCLPREGVFYDVGANWGYFSLSAAVRPGFLGEVHAFEPWPATYGDLSDLVHQLGLAERVTCHRLAVGEATAILEMTAGSHSGLARIGGAARGAVSVPVRPLDELNLAPPDVIKIDVEGHEEQVLSGAEGMLRCIRPMVLFEHRRENERQFNSHRPLALLESLGYRLFVPRCRNLAGAGSTQAVELINLRREERAKFPADANLFACHKSRLPEVAGALRERTLRAA